MQIIIDMADDGTVTVEADGIPTSTYDSAEEALEFVQGLLGGGEMEEPEEAAPESDEEAMWNEEAKRRPGRIGLMA